MIPLSETEKARLSIQGLRVVYEGRSGQRAGLSELSLEVKPRETVAIVGESGSGKTTLANAVLGLLPRGAQVTSGRILLEGHDLLSLSAREMRRVRGARIGMVFQDPLASLHPMYKVGFQLSEGISNHRRLSGREVKERVASLLGSVGFSEPSEVAERYPHELSSGQRQRVMLAMGLANDPDLLIADEPTSMLDRVLEADLLGLLKRRKDEVGMSLVLIMHDIELAVRHADSICVLHAGRVVEVGPARRVLGSPEHPYTKALLAARTPRERRRGISSDVRAKEAKERAAEAPVLELNSVSKDYEVRRPLSREHRVGALFDVGCELHRGETLGIVGESGSGKSTLARLAVRLLRPSTGSIRLFGHDVTRLSERELRRLRRRVQIVLQDPYAALNPTMTVGAIVREGIDAQELGASDDERMSKVVAALLQVGLTEEFLRRLPAELSGGQRQRVALARALAVGPELLVCDEVVSSLDWSQREQVLAVLSKLQQESSLSLLFITHDLRLAEHMCDRVIVLYRGRIVEQGPTSQVMNAPSHPHTRALLKASPDREADFFRTHPKEAPGCETEDSQPGGQPRVD